MSASEVFKELAKDPENRVCVDCGKSGAQWASVSHGILMCLECSGKHRGLGVHISFVRSSTMDSWSPQQLQYMVQGGNRRFKDYLASYSISDSVPIVEKYYTRAVHYYREALKAQIQSRFCEVPQPSLEEGILPFMQMPETPKPVPKPQETNWWGGLWDKAGSWARETKQSIKEKGIFDKVKAKAESVYDQSREAGSKFYGQVSDKEKWKKFSEKSWGVINNVGNIAYEKTKDVYGKVRGEQHNVEDFTFGPRYQEPGDEELKSEEVDFKNCSKKSD